MIALRVTFSLAFCVTLALASSLPKDATTRALKTTFKYSTYSTPGVELTKVGEGLYYFGAEPMNFFAAERFCRINTLDLIAIDTMKEHHQVSEHIIRTNFTGVYESYWTSGIDFDKSGEYYWSQHGQPMNLNLWRPNIGMSKTEGQHCVAAQNLNNQQFKWISQDCYRKIHFVCEKLFVSF